MKLLLRLSLLSPVFALAYATTLTLDVSNAATVHYDTDTDTPLSTAVIDALRGASTPAIDAAFSPLSDSSALVKQGSTPVSLLEDEIQTLRRLEHDVQNLYTLISEQKGVIHDLAHQSFTAGKDEIKQCGTTRCVVGTFFQHVRMCMHLFYARYGPSGELEGLDDTTDDSRPTSSNPLNPTEFRPRFRSTSFEVCSGRVTQADTTTVASASIKSSTLEMKSHETLFWILAIFGILFSLLCVVKVVHHCHNDPRRRAERAARREERQKTREYRRAARWQALKNLWYWRQPKRIGDYEEKRSLILAQENVLEGVMQQEITQLRLAHGIVEDIVHAAEEGRLPTIDEISRVIAADRRSRRSSPPTYRSGASSTQPPSYHTDDEESFMPVVNEYEFKPSGEGCALSGTDITPESSVVNLSPRNSCETLRTLYSAV